MTTYTSFVPSKVTLFQFPATLDGASYTVTVPWNVFGQRWYVNIADQSGNPIVSEALVGSPDPWALSALTWADGLVFAMTATPLGMPVGSSAQLLISGATPSAYNGLVQVTVTGPSSFTYPITLPPGNVTVLGSAFYNIDMTGGYFNSTMVYRDSTGNFEVSP